MKYLKKFNETVNDKSTDELALRNASKDGNIDLIKSLLDKGVDPNSCYAMSFIYACEYGQLESVKCLLESGKLTEGIIRGFQFVYKRSKLDDSDITLYKLKTTTPKIYSEIADYILNWCKENRPEIVNELEKNKTNL